MECSPASQLGPATSSEPSDSVIAFLDESYDPFVAAAAAILESDDMNRLDSKLADLYRRLQNWYHLDGMPSFEEFRQRGFHATSDPLEVRLAFVAFLAESLNFKSMIVYSDRSLRPDLSDKKRLILIFDQLIGDIIRAYRSRSQISLYFESAQGMDKYVERLVARRVASLGRKAPEIEVHFGSKKDPHLLAVADYVLHIFNQWLSTQGGQNALLDPALHQSRSFKAILGSISMARSLDVDRTFRRRLR